MTVDELPEALHPLDHSCTEIINHHDLRQALFSVLDTIKPIEKEVLILYFGLDGEELSIKCIADKIRKSRGTVSGIINAGIRKLKHPRRIRMLREFMPEQCMRSRLLKLHPARSVKVDDPWYSFIKPEPPPELPEFYQRWAEPPEPKWTLTYPYKHHGLISPIQVVKPEFIVNNLPCKKVGATWVSDQKSGKFVLARMSFMNRIVDRMLAIGYYRTKLGSFASHRYKRIIRLAHCIGHDDKLWIQVCKMK